MHCFVLCSPGGRQGWDIHRSVEVLAYHPEDEQHVDILLLLLARSTVRGNSLRLLHRGTVECRPVPAWPLPRHESESEDSHILQELYGSLFDGEADPSLSRDLTPWDSWMDVVAEPVQTSGFKFSPDCVRSREVEPAPFTSWTVRGLDVGWHLFAFQLRFAGATYDELLQGGAFSVDGPERILSRIEYGTFAAMTEADRQPWRESLAEFLDPNHRLDCTSYDIVLLTEPPAVPVLQAPELCANGIYLAPMQPTGAQRYLTTDPNFTLPLRFDRFESTGRDRLSAPLAAAL
jgi:hypothetical protein